MNSKPTTIPEKECNRLILHECSQGIWDGKTHFKRYTPSPIQEDWEERFDEIWPNLYTVNPGLGQGDARRAVKEFIKSTLTTAKRKQAEEILGAIDPFDLVENCVPDCTPAQHQYHQGTWNSYLKLEKIIDELKSKYLGEREYDKYLEEERGSK